MCTCADKADALLAPKNTRISWAFGQTGSHLHVATVKIDPKKRGNPVRLMCAYCPFCGEKWVAS